MLDTIRDWPLPAKALGAFTGAAAAVGGWSVVASAALMAYLDQPITHLPLTEWFAYAEHAPNAAWSAAANARVATGLKLSAAVPFVPVALAGAAALLASAKPRLAHDDARWANWRDLRHAGFSARTGSYLGRMAGRWVRSGTGRKRRNTAIMAPTQSGKGVGFVLPAGLCDPKQKLSLAFFDPKFQAFVRTAGWQRAIGARVILFAPLSQTGQTAQYNPCAYVRRSPDGSPTVDTWGDIESIVQKQIASVGDKQKFWTDNARLAYTALMAFQSETDGADFSIPGTLDLMFRQDVVAYITGCLDERRAAGRPYSMPCATNLRDFLSGNDEVRDGIRKTIKSELGIFFNPRVRAATSGNTFDLTRIMRERTALYVGVDFADIDKLRPLTTLLFQQLVALNTRGMPGADLAVTHDLLLVIDEFTNAGAMPDLAGAFSYSLEYGISIMPVFQTPGHLDAVYPNGGGKRILDNCKDKVILGGLDDMDFCKVVSRRLGTVKGERRSGPAGWFGKGNTSVSESERPLMSEYEVSQLPDDRALLLHGGSPGVLLKRIRYYDMQPFKRRAGLPPPVISAITVDLRYDETHDVAVPPHLEPGGPPAPATPAAKGPARPRKPADAALEADMVRAEAGMTLAQAEGVLAAVSPGIDLSRFAPDPAGAQALIDRVVHGAPAAKPARKQRKAA